MKNEPQLKPPREPSAADLQFTAIRSAIVRFLPALLCVAAMSTPALGQLVSVTNTSPGFPVVKFEPETGVVSHVADTNVYGNWAATSDPVGRRYFSFSGGVGSEQITITSLATGSVVTHSLAYPEWLSGAIFAVEYDSRSGMIWAVTTAPALLSIDPSTGSVTDVFPITRFDSSGYTVYNHAFDTTGRRLFILRNVKPGVGSLITLNVDSWSGRMLPVRWASGFPLGMEFDEASDSLLVALSTTSSPLLAVDTRSGTATELMLLGLAGGRVGWTAFDATHRRFFFKSDGDPGRLAIATIGIPAVQIVGTPSAWDAALFYEYVPAAMPIPALSPLLLLCFLFLLCVAAMARLR